MSENRVFLRRSDAIGAVISPTFDWKPNPAFPTIDGAVHWDLFGSNWQRVAHGWADTMDEARAAVRDA